MAGLKSETMDEPGFSRRYPVPVPVPDSSFKCLVSLMPASHIVWDARSILASNSQMGQPEPPPEKLDPWPAPGQADPQPGQVLMLQIFWCDDWELGKMTYRKNRCDVSINATKIIFIIIFIFK
jgi:hypothetical protein